MRGVGAKLRLFGRFVLFEREPTLYLVLFKSFVIVSNNLTRNKHVCYINLHAKKLYSVIFEKLNSRQGTQVKKLGA